MGLYEGLRSWTGWGGSDRGGSSGAAGKRTLVGTELGHVRRSERAAAGDLEPSTPPSLGGGVIDVPGLGPIPIMAIEQLLRDPNALASIDPETLRAIGKAMQVPIWILIGPLPFLVDWLLERLKNKGANPPAPPTPPTPPGPTPGAESRHDLLAKISAERRRLLPSVESEHTPDGRIKAQLAMLEVLSPLLDKAAAFPADTRYEHPDRQIQDDVLAAVQLRAAMQAHSRLGDKNAEAEARKQSGLAKGQWCGAFAYAHASGAGLDSDFAGDAMSTGPNQGLDNLFGYKDPRRWIWTGAEWKNTHEYHNDRGSVRHFTLVPANPSPSSLDIRPGDVVLKDNYRGTFADHITTCAAYDPSTGMLTTIGGNEGSNTPGGAGVGEGTMNIGANPTPQDDQALKGKPTRIYAIGRWSVADFEDHVFSTSPTKPTQAPNVAPKPSPGPKPGPTPGPKPTPPPPPGPRRTDYPQAPFDWTTVKEPTAEQRRQLIAIAQTRAAMPARTSGDSRKGLARDDSHAGYPGGYKYTPKGGRPPEDRRMQIIMKELWERENGVAGIVTWDGTFSLGPGLANGSAAQAMVKWQSNSVVANALRGAGVWAKDNWWIAVTDAGDVVGGNPALQILRNSIPLMSMIMDLAEDPEHGKQLDLAEQDWIRDKHLKNLPKGAEAWADVPFVCAVHINHGYPAYGWCNAGLGGIYLEEGQSGAHIARAFAKAHVAAKGNKPLANGAIAEGVNVNGKRMVREWMPSFGGGMGDAGYLIKGVKSGRALRMSLDELEASTELAGHIVYVTGGDVKNHTAPLEMFDLGSK